MGINCPKCSTQTEIDFGMAQCESCQAVFYINVDGSVNFEDEAQAPVDSVVFENPEPIIQETKTHGEVHTNVGDQVQQADLVQAEGLGQEFNTGVQDIVSLGVESFDDQSNLNSSEPEPYSGWGDVPEDVGGVESFGDNQDVESVEADLGSAELVQENDSTWGESNEVGNLTVSDKTDQAEPPQAEVSGLEAMKSDVVDFGNSESSSIRQGPIMYDLEISGLDTREEKNIIYDILNDRKLMLAVDEYMSELQDGMIKIRGLNPIKASVIVAGLHNTGIKVDWRQSVFND